MLRRLLASVLSVIFVICFTPCFLLISFLQTYLNPSFYYTDFLDFSYERAIGYISNEIIDNNDELLKNFSESEIKEIIGETFDKELLRNFIVSFVYEIKNLGDKTSITISLSDLQNKIPSLTSKISELYIEKIPDCKDSDEINILECKPGYISDKKFSDLLADEIIKNFLNVIPDNIEIKESDDHRLFNLLSSLNLYTKITFIGIIIFLGILLLIIGLLVFKPIKKVMRYISVNLIIGSILTIITAFIVKNFFIYFQPLFNLPEGLSNDNLDYYSFFLSFYSKQLIINSLVVLGFGILILTVSLISGKTKSKESEIIKEDISKEIDKIISLDIEKTPDQKKESEVKINNNKKKSSSKKSEKKQNDKSQSDSSKGQ